MNPRNPTPGTQHPKPARQAWIIAKSELRRAFFMKRAFWVYGLALLPSVIFFGHGIEAKLRRDRLSSGGLVQPALIDSARKGEKDGEVLKRLGRPGTDQRW